jgi:hypothetical protein
VAKKSTGGSASRLKDRHDARPARGDRGQSESVRRAGKSEVGKMRFRAIMQAAEQSGLLAGKDSRIASRVSPALVRQAKQRTGIETDTDLIEYALASVALEDEFAETFRKARGTVDPRLKLGF